MVGSSEQRSEVWRGLRKKTSGGLVKADLIKNKRGKVVSAKKSQQASNQNNLGLWLREKGKKVAKADMIRKKSAPPPGAPISKKPPKKKAAPKAKPKAAPKAKPKPAAPKPKAAAPKPKPAAPKPKPAAPKPKAAAPKAAPKKVRQKPKAAVVRKKINPITQQPYDKTEASGYVADSKVSLDNLKRTSMRPRRRRRGEALDWSSHEVLGSY